jgi:hypothetical protein
MKARWILGVTLVSAAGCGGELPTSSPVSGIITLNGKPLAGAMIIFSPIAGRGEVLAGDGSAGKTNAAGEYSLTSSRGRPGAQVGKHRVRISIVPEQAGDERRPRSRVPIQSLIPLRYNEHTELAFDVTGGGPNKADFALTSP